MSCRGIRPFGKSIFTVLVAAMGIGAGVVGWYMTREAAGNAEAGVVEKTAPATPAAQVSAKSLEEAGRYLVRIGGCNECHTPGFAMRGGDVPEAEWLVGDSIGWYGPWGTSYASNLRLMVAEMPEDVWVKMMHERHERPPMPWTSVNAMSEPDVRAMYRYIKLLGKRGEKMPEPLGPGREPPGAYLSMIPQSPKGK